MRRRRRTSRSRATTGRISTWRRGFSRCSSPPRTRRRAWPPSSRARARVPRPMRLLVLGGTLFVGRHLVEAALERGHEVTLFNRGRTNLDLFPQVERLQGDRDGDLSALEGRSWDAVFDPSGYVPRVVRASAEALVDSVGHYTFVSSGSVLSLRARLSRRAESRRGARGGDRRRQQGVRGAEGAGGARGRAGLPWPHARPPCRSHRRELRLDEPIRVLDSPRSRRRRGARPAPRDWTIQIVDARDLVDWALDRAEQGEAGTFNVAGPERPITIEELVETAKRQAAATPASPGWTRISCSIKGSSRSTMCRSGWRSAVIPSFRASTRWTTPRHSAPASRFVPLEETIAAPLPGSGNGAFVPLERTTAPVRRSPACHRRARPKCFGPGESEGDRWYSGNEREPRAGLRGGEGRDRRT